MKSAPLDGGVDEPRRTSPPSRPASPSSPTSTCRATSILVQRGYDRRPEVHPQGHLAGPAGEAEGAGSGRTIPSRATRRWRTCSTCCATTSKSSPPRRSRRPNRPRPRVRRCRRVQRVATRPDVSSCGSTFGAPPSGAVDQIERHADAALVGQGLGDGGVAVGPVGLQIDRAGALERLRPPRRC